MNKGLKHNHGIAGSLLPNGKRNTDLMNKGLKLILS